MVTECAAGFWYCAEKRLCMPDEWRCDGFHDCGDYDENPANCSKPVYIQTAAQYWVLRTKQRIRFFFWRIFKLHILHKFVLGKCASDEFECRNHECIDLALVCDATNDCSDGTDETTCLLFDGGTQPVTLAPGGDTTTQYRICASSNSIENQFIADLACL